MARRTAMRDYEAERREYVAELVAAAPPISDETRETLAGLLRPVVVALRRARAARAPRAGLR